MKRLTIYEDDNTEEVADRFIYENCKIKYINLYRVGLREEREITDGYTLVVGNDTP